MGSYFDRAPFKGLDPCGPSGTGHPSFLQSIHLFFSALQTTASTRDTAGMILQAKH